MYLHIGNNKMIRKRNIIGIFDMDTSTVGEQTRKFLRAAQKSGKTESAAEDIPKAFIVSDGGRVYLSQLSTATLRGRAARRH